MPQTAPDRALEQNPAPGFRDHPDHSITLAPADKTVSVMVGDMLIARSDRALIMKEGAYPPVYYLPMDDIQQQYLRRSAHSTHCPFKGDASYWNIAIGDHEIDNSVWGYEMPYDEMLEIAGMVAFYPNKVSISQG